MNNIKTWTQGKFIYSNKYKHWTFEEKERAKYEELLRVRPGLKDNHICVCNDPEDAKWIASRLNLLKFHNLYMCRGGESEQKPCKRGKVLHGSFCCHNCIFTLRSKFA